jgi:RNA polymerase sigma-70 factor (ECF subfamily)
MEQIDQQRARFEAAVDEWASSLYRVAYRWCGDRERAEEIVQETFIGAWSNIDQLEKPERIKSWLFGVLRNQFLKSCRSSQRTLQMLDSIDVVAPINKKSELQQQVQEAIAMLDEDQRLPILLVSMEGWSTEEAAQLLGIPQGTVLSRLHRGRQRLKEILIRERELDEVDE